jgi:hypothetical protein
MKLALVQTAFNKMILSVLENTNVDIFNATISGLTVVSMTVLGTGGETVDFNTVNGKFIVYDTVKADPILKNGNLLEITFDIEQDDYGTYPITVTDAVGADNNATEVVIGDVSANLRITFSSADVVATVAHLVGKGSSGIDANKDGKVSISDLAKIINNL